MSIQAEKGIRKYAFIDALRGIAILMVILVHCSESISWQGHLSALDSFGLALSSVGRRGVQLFFVASALTLSLSMDSRGWSRKEIAGFYTRRFFRIAPIYYLGILVYGSLRILHHSPGADSYSFPNILANVLLVHGFIPSANNTIVPGGWSIGTEILFYAIFPLIFMMYKTKGVSRLAYLFLGYVAILGLIGSAARRLGLEVGNNSFAYFNILIQCPVFLAGIFCFDVIKFHPERISTPATALISAALLAASTILTELLWKSGYFVFVPALYGISFAFLTLAMSRLNNIPNWLASVGKNSYSMYILHFLFAWGLAKPLASRFLHDLQPALALMIVFTISASLSYILANITSKYIEKRFIDLGNTLVKKINDRPSSAILQRIPSEVPSNVDSQST